MFPSLPYLRPLPFTFVGLHIMYALLYRRCSDLHCCYCHGPTIRFRMIPF